MPEIALFVEDHAHYQFLDALLKRLAHEYDVPIKLNWQNSRRGHGAVVRELKQYLRDLQRGREGFPDLVIVATDANCKGLVERLKEVNGVTDKVAARIVCAVPDPHIERWLLLDSAAFKAVFRRGCNTPDQKCERMRYKKMLIDAIRQAGITPSFGGTEFAKDIVKEMNLNRTARNDGSLGRLLGELRSVFQEWRQ